MPKTKNPSWRDVPLTHIREGRPASAAERAEAMIALRDTGCVNDFFICTVDDYHATDDGDALADLGPGRGGVDYEGLGLAYTLVVLAGRWRAGRGWAEWPEIAAWCGLKEQAPWGASTPSLSDAIDYAARDAASHSRALLVALRDAGVRVDRRRGSVGEPVRFYAPAALVWESVNALIPRLG
jgi:hypothetical protein